MANPWFRMYSEFMHDPKVQMMTEQDQRRLVMLLCMRCNSDVTLQDKHVTFTLRISEQEWAQTKACFVASGFIDSDNNVLNWDKRQFVSDSSAARVAKHRALRKPVTVTPCNVTVTPPEQNRTDAEQSKTEEIHTTRISSLRKLLDRGVNDEIARDWLVIRKAKKLPLTDTAIKQVEAEAKIAGLSFGDAVAVAVRNGWAGYKSSWEDKSSVAPVMLVCPNGYPFSDWMKASNQEKAEIMANHGK